MNQGSAPKSLGYPETLSELVSVTDQLVAAVIDVREAWAEFQFGPRPEASHTPPDQAVEDDRLMRIGSGIHDQIASLRDLAQQIRGRA